MGGRSAHANERAQAGAIHQVIGVISTLETASSRIFHAWSAISHVAQAGDYLFVHLDAMNFEVMPLHAFDSPGEAAEFAALIRSKIGSATQRPAGSPLHEMRVEASSEVQPAHRSRRTGLREAALEGLMRGAGHPMAQSD